jgi:hypothetical protein
MATYRVKNEADKAKVLADIKRAPTAPKGFNVTCTRRTRTHEQNDLMWDLLTQFEKQGATINGQTFKKEAWKAIFLNALGFDSDMLPTLDGESFFAEGYRSSKLKVPEMTALIDRIFQEGAERGIKFRQDQELAA